MRVLQRVGRVGFSLLRETSAQACWTARLHRVMRLLAAICRCSETSPGRWGRKRAPTTMQ
eukprot:3632264-Pleurochrysis_carterae.AAC.1